MKYGCIGEKLGHSFSREIHAALADYEYELREVAPDDLAAFAAEGDFLAINVTIPYKEKILPFLYSVDAPAAAIGAVNTVVRRGGRLYGYNTDFYGMQKLLSHAGISLAGRKVAILGTGGTSRTAEAVAKAGGAARILRVSRREGADTVGYETLATRYPDTEVIINTTPVGMYPHIFERPLSLDPFPRLCGVIDAVYNPLRTPLVCAAQARGVPAEGGLYMLVAQAVRALEIFLDTVYPPKTTETVYQKMRRQKENIVLIGMPGVGKSTVGKKLAAALHRPFYDTDLAIAEEAGRPAADLLRERGEAVFREVESGCIRALAPKTGAVIATGGGAVLRAENTAALRENGRIYFLERPLGDIRPGPDRPLSQDAAALGRLWTEREALYRGAADVQIDAASGAEETARRIREEFTV